MRSRSVSFFLCLIFTTLFASAKAQPQKIVAECTITYDVTMPGKSKPLTTERKLYIKGKKTRSEIAQPPFYQATIFDNKTGEAVVLKEIGNDRYLSLFTADEWKEKNRQWSGSQVTITKEIKVILGYSCRKAVITTADNQRFEAYFTTDLIASATENPYQFKDIPGLILEFQFGADEGSHIQFLATHIDFSPVPAAKFEIPKTGYKIITETTEGAKAF